MLKTLTEANGISDANEINQIQKEMSVVDDVNIGLLAQKVRHAFKNTRKKDALAAKICLLTKQLMQALRARNWHIAE